MKNTKKGKNINKALLMGTALVALSAPQAHAATSSADMSAVIITPIDIANSALHFGSMTVNDATGTVTISPDGVTARASTGGVSLVTSGLNPDTRGVLTITAATGIAMDVNLNAAGVPYIMSDLGAVGLDMTVDTFLFRDVVAGTTAATIDVTQTGASITVPVGATLNVPALQRTTIGTSTPANYFGTYDVDVNYQ